MGFSGLIGKDESDAQPGVQTLPNPRPRSGGAAYHGESPLTAPNRLWYRPDDDAGAASHAGTVWLVWVKG
jgi:hypothetical protein